METLQDHIAIVEGHVDNKRFEVYPFRKETLIVVAHPDVDELANLVDLPWIIRERGSGTREKSEQMWQQLSACPKQVITLNNNEAVLQSVAAGLGLALVPQVSATNLLAAGLLIKIVPHYSSWRQLSAVVHPAMREHPMVINMLTILACQQKLISK